MEQGDVRARRLLPAYHEQYNLAFSSIWNSIRYVSKVLANLCNIASTLSPPPSHNVLVSSK